MLFFLATLLPFQVFILLASTVRAIDMYFPSGGFLSESFSVIGIHVRDLSMSKQEIFSFCDVLLSTHNLFTSNSTGQYNRYGYRN